MSNPRQSNESKQLNDYSKITPIEYRTELNRITKECAEIISTLIKSDEISKHAQENPSVDALSESKELDKALKQIQKIIIDDKSKNKIQFWPAVEAAIISDARAKFGFDPADPSSQGNPGLIQVITSAMREALVSKKEFTSDVDMSETKVSASKLQQLFSERDRLYEEEPRILRREKMSKLMAPFKADDEKFAQDAPAVRALKAQEEKEARATIATHNFLELIIKIINELNPRKTIGFGSSGTITDIKNVIATGKVNKEIGIQKAETDGQKLDVIKIYVNNKLNDLEITRREEAEKSGKKYVPLLKLSADSLKEQPSQYQIYVEIHKATLHPTPEARLEALRQSSLTLLAKEKNEAKSDKQKDSKSDPALAGVFKMSHKARLIVASEAGESAKNRPRQKS